MSVIWCLLALWLLLGGFAYWVLLGGDRHHDR